MSINKNNLAIIIPVFNEQDIIEKVIYDWLFIAKKFDGFIIVINDGSSDNSLKILNKIRKKNNRLMVINKKNSGHGNTCKYGYDLITNKNYSYDYILQIDSDNQCNPKYLIDFLNIAEKKHESFIFGYRKRREDGYIRFLTSRILSFSIFCKKLMYIKDANTPYRLMKTSNLKKILNRISKNKNYKDIDLFNCILTYEIKKNYNIKWIDINFRKRVYGNSKFGTLKMLKLYSNLITMI